MKYFLIYLSFITSSLASLTAADCGDDQFSLSKAYVTKENAISCQKIHYFQSTVEDISELFNDAPPVRLLISPKSSNASFDYGETVYIPLQMTFPGKYGSVNYGDPTQTEYILAHEYGHAVFTKLLSRNNFYKDIYAVDKEFSQLEFESKFKSDLDEETLQRINELRDKKNDYNKVRKLLTDYSEFFADVIAVYYSNNKETMLNALYFDAMSDQSYNLVLARSFSERRVDISDRIYTEEHASLVLARHFVGANLWPKTKEQKVDYLQSIFNVIEEEILERLERKEYRLSAKKMNNSLIKRLKSIMSL
ncbi:hypothetical protein [Halobacteriovorax sp.]|uniref:hypothetical protein n=1 Tax=Halobacteriovorax sp. TaxID=2020862 RepID=UPI00356907F6